jgi:GNAT superfamily N-acetyltransferase
MSPQIEREGLRIRRARSSDATRLAELSRQLGYPVTPRELRERLARLRHRAQHAVFVAAAPARGVVGWLHVSVVPLLESALHAEINGLVVDENRRGQGAGAQLLAAAVAWARTRRCQYLSVRSNVIRERAHRFYQRHGFEHTKTQKAFRKPL